MYSTRINRQQNDKIHCFMQYFYYWRGELWSSCRSAFGRCVITVRLSLLLVVHCFQFCFGSCLRLTERKHIKFFLLTLHIYLQDFKHSHPDVARRAVLPSVRRCSLSQVKCRIRSFAIPCRTAPPTPASHWTSASPLPQFHVQIRLSQQLPRNTLGKTGITCV